MQIKYTKAAILGISSVFILKLLCTKRVTHVKLGNFLNSVTLTRSRIEASIPRKHGPSVAGYDKV